MEQYTDEERVEDLKKWWQENGASIIIGIALGLVVIFGWQYWGSYRNSKAEQASLAYDAFIVAVEKPDADQAQQRGQALLNDFPNSPYSALAALRLAKLSADGGDTANASQRLEWVINNAKLDELKDIARLRLARLLFAANNLADAEQHLAKVATASLTAEREELRGDMALAGHDLTKARTAYTAALAASGGNPLLQLKLDNLNPAGADSLIVAPTAPPTPTPTETPQTTTAPSPATPSAAPEASAAAPTTATELAPPPAITEPAPSLAPTPPPAAPTAAESVPSPVTPTAPPAPTGADAPVTPAPPASVPTDPAPSPALTVPTPVSAPPAPGQ